MRSPLIIYILLQCISGFSQNSIISGPMRGFATMTEIGIWLQVESPAPIEIHYWDGSESDMKVADPTKVYSREGVYKFNIGGLEPGTEYNYDIYIDGERVEKDNLTFKTQVLWQYRTDPPPIRIALGSCNYINEEPYERPGKPYGSQNGIFSSIASMKPDLMLWLGDNIYLREVDFQSKSGYIHRNTHTRSASELQELLSTTNNYAIWDDHDFGPDDANGSWIHKDWALESFEMFWMNPSTGIPGEKGITTSFRFGDVDFFLLDNRYNRTSRDTKHVTPQILGKTQIDWLIEAMKYGNAPYKLIAVGGQVLNDAAVFENYAQYADERKYLIDRIVEERIEGVVFLTGDRHHSELSMIERDGIEIYDLTVSPLTSGVHGAIDEPNTNRVAGTHVAEHNYGIIEISGSRLARKLNISIFGKSGEEIWRIPIDQ